jgi:hypothetical protein
MRAARPGRGRAAALAIGLVWLARPTEARAQELDLTWQAPATCPSADQVKSEFERSVRVRPGRTPPRLTAIAVVEQIRGRWFLHLHTKRDELEGQREIEADSCASLARATALVLTLALGEGDMVEENAAPPAPAPPPAPEPAPALAPAPARDSVPAPVRRRPLVWAVAADARSSWGPLPGRSVGFGAGVDVRAKWWGVKARVESWPGSDQGPAPGLQTHFDGIAGSASLCLLGSPLHVLALSVCAGFQASALRGSSSGATSSETAIAPWYAVLSSVGVRVPVVEPVHIDLAFELATTLKPPRFVVNGLGEVYVVPALVPNAVGGLSVDL